MSKKSQSNLSSLLGVVVLVALGAAFYLYRPQADKPAQENLPPIDSVVVTDSDMALALLDEEDVSDAMGKDLNAALVQFNAHMEPTEGYEYVSYVGRIYADPADHKEYVSSAVTKYVDQNGAQAGIEFKAGKDPRLTLDKTIGDKTLAHYTVVSEDSPDSVSLRFTAGNFSAKVQVWDVNDEVSSVENSKVLLDKAWVMAEKQIGSLKSLADGKLLYDNVDKNDASERLPVSLEGATYIGSSAFKASEWIEMTHEDGTKLAGFQSGGLSRFQLVARSEEILEVSVMKFEENKQAIAYRDSLLVGGAFADENGKAIKLPENLAKDALAMHTDYVAEFEFVRGPYLIDVVIFSPFGEINKTASEADIVKFGEMVMNWFNE